VFLERFVESPRHVEVQVLGDTHGSVVHLFERECSIQRRHQKVVEESPSPGIDDAVRAALGEAAVAAAQAIGYVNAGTVEFIADETVLARRRAGEDVDPREAFAFLEVNTRLQVEHPVTEEVVRARTAAGTLDPIDLVRLQLLVAMGEPLPFAQDDLVQVGHAIEVRLYAEDPANGYLPATGTLAAFEPAVGEGLRYDLGIRAGDTVSTYYDPMLAKVIATAPTRREAAGRLARALDRTVLHGTTTNRDLLVAVLRDEAFLAGDTTTAFLDERYPDDEARRFAPADADVEVALIAAALAGAATRRAASDGARDDPVRVHQHRRVRARGALRGRGRSAGSATGRSGTGPGRCRCRR
jgi:propionyl-CoA carboxylase alpha chain